MFDLPKKNKWLYPFIIGALSFALALFFVSKELSKLRERKASHFQSTSIGKALYAKNLFEQKKNFSHMVKRFFEASNFVSEDEFNLFLDESTKEHNLLQVCWTSSVDNSLYAVNRKRADLCEKVDPLETSDIIVDRDNSKVIVLSDFAQSSNKKQKGLLSIFFRIDSILQYENIFNESQYLQYYFFVNNVSHRFYRFNFRGEEEKGDISSLKKHEESFYKDLDSIGAFRFVYFSKMKPQKSMSLEQIIAYLFGIIIFLLGILIAFIFRNMTIKQEKIEKLVRLKTDELRAANERYELMAQGASVGIWDWFDINQEEEYWSPRFYELLGYKNQEIKASIKMFQNILHPEDHERTFSLVEQHFKGEADFDLEYRLKAKGGEYRWFRGSGQVSYDAEGKPTRMVGSIQDIHDRVVAINELKRSNEDLDQFAYIASHDLREPLRGMRNFSQFLIEDYSDKLDEEGKNYLNVIKKLGTRLEKYLDSLMYFSRLGREAMSYRDVDLKELIEEVVETHRDVSGKEVELELDKKLPRLSCDPIKLSKIFGNLVQNAIRYNSNDIVNIYVGYKFNDEGLHQFFIKDDGIGIKKDHWKRIFTIFKRLHSKDEYDSGTGLGLTLVKKAVERHGGEIWVEESEEGKGTTFSFTIKERKK